MTFSFSTQSLFNLNFFSGKREELFDVLQTHLQNKGSLLTIATPNPEQVIQSRDNENFLKNLQQFDVLLPDGQGIVWSSRVLNQPITERITGVEMVEWLLAHEEKVLIIGGRDYQTAISFKPQVSSDKTKKLNILNKEVFWTEGYQDIKNPTEDEEKQVEQVVKEVKPSVVLVAFGAPWQEKWVIQRMEFLKENKVKVAMVVGGAIDMLTGKITRAPIFIQKMQLEWLFRLIQEPWRWRRQLRLARFIGIVLQQKLGLT